MKIYKNILLGLAFTLLTSCWNLSGKTEDKTPGTPKEYTTSELKEMGVNTDHLFSFTDSIMTYNGTPFYLGQTIDEMVQIFGPYSRVVKQTGHIYIWDELGIKMGTYLPTDHNTNQVTVFTIYWNLDLSQEKFGTSKMSIRIRDEIYENKVRNYFQGKVLVDGVPLGRGMTIEAFCDELKKKKSGIHPNNDPFPVLYRSYLYKFKYDQINISKYDVYQMVIRVTHDQSDIEQLNVAVVYDETNLRKNTYDYR